MIFNDHSYLEKLSQLVRWGHWYCFANILLAILVSTLYAVADPLPSTLLGNVYLILNILGHMAFVSFFIFIITVFPLCFVFPNSHFLRGWGTFVATTAFAFLLLDIWLYIDLGLHLQFSTANVVAAENQQTISNLRSNRWIFFLLSFILMLAIQLALSNFVWRRIDQLKSHKLGSYSALALVFCFITSHLIHIWADATLYQPIVRQDNMLPLSYPATAKTLMAKHGFLDEEAFSQRKQLSLNLKNRVLALNAEKLSCPANIEERVTIIAIKELKTKDIESEYWQKLANQYQLLTHHHHVDTGSNIASSIYNIITGLPEIYRRAEGEQSSLLSEILTDDQKLLVYPGERDSLIYFASETEKLNMPINWQGQLNNFYAAYDSASPRLSLVVIDKSFDIPKLLSKGGQIIITGLNPGEVVPLLTNIGEISPEQITGHTDIASSVFTQVYQCHGDTNVVSLGQNMFSPERDWLVNSYGSDIRFYQNNLVVTVNSNGSYRIKDIQTNQDIYQPLDIALLTRATAHLHSLLQ